MISEFRRIEKVRLWGLSGWKYYDFAWRNVFTIRDEAVINLRGNLK